MRARSDAILGLELAIGAAGVAAASLAVGGAAVSVHHTTGGAHDVVVAGQRFTYPAVNVAAALLLALALLGAVVVGALARSLWRQARDTRRFLRALPVAGALSGHARVLVIDDAAPQAFCAGWIRPRVYVSRGALELLDDGELGAVLAHEEAHRTARDPLRFACGRALARALIFLPAIGVLDGLYRELAESNADAAAPETPQLASALLAFEAAEPTGAAGISPERVDALLGRPRHQPLPAAPVALSVAIVAALVVVVWRASAAASARSTFNLPGLSSKPCMLVLALIPVAVVALASALSRPSHRR